MLVNKGWVTEDNNGIFRAWDDAVKCEADWIWLPNELVTGTAGETPPVEQTRQTQDVMTLRLLVDLYHAQNLYEDGGINRIFTHENFERRKVGQRGQYIVWGFRHGSKSATWAWPILCHQPRGSNLTEKGGKVLRSAGKDFFRRQQQLTNLGLIEWVPYLFDGESREAELIHPYGIGMGDTLEGRLCRAADEAGQALITFKQQAWAAKMALSLVPVPSHMMNVQMIGVARLRYRPKTQLTAAWWAELQTKGEQFIQGYNELTAGNLRQAAGFNGFATSRRDQGDIKARYKDMIKVNQKKLLPL